jgi:hypothetical protein
MLKRPFIAVAAIAAITLSAIAVPIASAGATAGQPGPLTLAVYGDAPYGQTAYAPGGQSGDTAELQKTAAFINTINADASVSEVIHVGDIHSGKDFCTQSWDNEIASLWQDYKKPLVYTPGDNEWTDCHKATSVKKPGEGGGFYDSTGTLQYIGNSGLTTDPSQCVDYACGDPLTNLALVRQLFFAQPGQTLGSGTMSVTSQANAYDPNHPADAQFVENVMWAQRDIVFVTINVPGGSNNDADPWYQAAHASDAQNAERAARTDADLRWLDAAFALAHVQHAKGVVISTQADMWDAGGNPSHLSNFEPIISDIAAQTSNFGRPVLLFNGDSHIYRSDNPLVQGAPCVMDNAATGTQTSCAQAATDNPSQTLTADAWTAHPNYDVSNFHRVIVHGSTLPLEWLKLIVDPNANNKTTSTSFGPFSWQRQTQAQL